MASVYYRPTRSGRKSDKQPRTRDFKKSTFLSAEDDGPENKPDAVLPPISVHMLSSVISRLISRDITVNAIFRQYYVIGTWDSGNVRVTSFCIQPDVSSCMCNIRGATVNDVRSSVDEVSEIYHDYSAPSCAIKGRDSRSKGGNDIPDLFQLSGRLVPYVFERILEKSPGATCIPTFHNMSRCRIGFVVYSNGETRLRSLGKNSIQTLKPHFPTWSGCLLHSSLRYYRVLCSPDPGLPRSEGNHSGAVLYMDGRVRFQGDPDVCSRSASAIHHALNSVLRSKSWAGFVSSLDPYGKTSNQQVGFDTLSVADTAIEARSISTFASYA